MTSEKGIAAVEFALALMGLLLFFAIFIQFFIFFAANERATFAGFAASRVFSVQGIGPAVETSEKIDSDSIMTFETNRVAVARQIPMPSGINNFLTQGRGFSIEIEIPTFNELDYKNRLEQDDNDF
ncbi:hypothetical protein [Desulfonatronovibrio magnus]|uniref:hypothetical protein n=1 Tax=Desulfonatronovibrio magnus TaxID=698827 RepID=UPI0005EB2CFF|nr:hypothetical protein [Desulfonatronovibrio magnus]